MSDSVRPLRQQPTRLLVLGILQARTLEWVAISFSNAWKWKVKVKSLSRVRPHGLQPTRLLHPWDFPGKSTGVGCHFLLQCMIVKSEREVTQSCPTLSDPMDCSLPGSSIHGIFQARVLEWGAIVFSYFLWKHTCSYLCRSRQKFYVQTLENLGTKNFWWLLIILELMVSLGNNMYFSFFVDAVSLAVCLSSCVLGQSSQKWGLRQKYLGYHIGVRFLA